MFKTKKFTMIEVLVQGITSANARIYIQNQPQLQTIDGLETIFVKMIEAYSSDQVTKSPLTTLQSVATPAAIKNATLTIVCKGREEIQYIPLADLCKINGGTTPFSWQPFLLDNVANIDWSKSYIQMQDIPAAQPFSYLFGIHYSNAADVPVSTQQINY